MRSPAGTGPTRPPAERGGRASTPPVLRHLEIRDLVLIDRLALDFSGGLTVLTGETGAGKSILLDGLGIVLGMRADAALVRTGAARAQVAALFRLPPGHPAFDLLDAQGIACEEPGEILVRRALMADGGSRAHVNDAAVSVTVLRQLGQLLVEVHGQHDDRGLLDPRGHRALLDSFGGHEKAFAAVAAAHAAAEAAAAAHAAALASAEADAREADWLTHAADELQRLAPRPGEEAELASLRQTLQQASRIGESLDAVDALLGGGDGALARLRQAARRLERIDPGDPSLATAIDGIDRALTALDEAESALADTRQRLAGPPDALEAAEARLFELRAAARKHRVAVDELPALAADLARRRDALAGRGDRIGRLEAEAAAARAALGAACAALTRARSEAARRLDQAVAAELPDLRLGAARFRTVIEPAEPQAHGADQVRFEIMTNPGQPFGPLTRIASGGELSRFILALKVALAGRGSAATLVFDEVDRGMGGATASAIGQRLHRLGRGAQLLVVTHSPQVAALGDAHLRIDKESGTTRVTPLDPPARTAEVARMLSGETITPEARAQAARLLEGAA